MAQEENNGQTYNGFANRYYKQSRKQRGGRLLRQNGDARDINKPKKKNENEKKKKAGRGHKPT